MNHPGFNTPGCVHVPDLKRLERMRSQGFETRSTVCVECGIPLIKPPASPWEEHPLIKDESLKTKHLRRRLT